MELPAEFVLVGGRVIDPAQGLDALGWVHVRDGTIARLGHIGESMPPVERVDAADLIVCPGLIDTHVHLREPGFSHKETIATGSSAAAAGGFTAVCCMPNTSPTLDDPQVLHWVQEEAARAGKCRVYAVAAATRGRRGEQLVDFAALAAAGAVAFSDDGDGIESDEVCRKVLEACRGVDRPYMPHCEFKKLSDGGVMHAGHVSDGLQVPGYDPAAEEEMIARDIALAEAAGARLHVAHISTSIGIKLVRAAKARGARVTTEVCPHHLLLCDEDVVDANGYLDPNRKMSPPLRSADDVAACVAATRDGTIDCICTDHAPHSADEKARGFLKAPMGVVGLETSLACAALALLERESRSDSSSAYQQPGAESARAMGMLGRNQIADKPRVFGWPQLIEKMSTRPAQILSLPGGSLRPGAQADIALIDPQREWTVDPEAFLSKSRNTAFAGWPLRGKVVATLLRGRATFAERNFADRAG